MTPKAQAAEESKGKLDFMRIWKSMCVKRQRHKQATQRMGAIMDLYRWFANHLSDKELISRIYRELLKLYDKTNSLIQKCMNDLNRHFCKKDIHMKRCPMSLVIREMEIKITPRYHLTLVRTATMKTHTENIISVGKDAEELELLHTVQGNIKWYSHCTKKLQTVLLHEPAIQLLSIYSKEFQAGS